MMFLFAFYGVHHGQDATIRLVHGTEVVFVVVALAYISLAVSSSLFGLRVNRWAVAVVGGISGSFALLMPLELAPYFFDIGGEVMMATMVLNLVYPVFAVIFASRFLRFMNPRRDQLRVSPGPSPIETIKPLRPTKYRIIRTFLI